MFNKTTFLKNFIILHLAICLKLKCKIFILHFSFKHYLYIETQDITHIEYFTYKYKLHNIN